MHGHYLLKLIASLAQVRKTPMYSNIFIQKFCTLFNVLYLHNPYGHKVLSICHG